MLKNFKFSAIRAAFVALLPLLLHLKFTFAGGAPGVSLPPLATIFPDVPHLAAAMLGWYELLVRVVPTAQNYSLLRLLHDLLSDLVPNAAIAYENADDGTHVLLPFTTSYPNAGGTGAVAA